MLPFDFSFPLTAIPIVNSYHSGHHLFFTSEFSFWPFTPDKISSFMKTNLSPDLLLILKNCTLMLVRVFLQHLNKLFTSGVPFLKPILRTRLCLQIAFSMPPEFYPSESSNRKAIASWDFSTCIFYPARAPLYFTASRTTTILLHSAYPQGHLAREMQSPNTQVSAEGLEQTNRWWHRLTLKSLCCLVNQLPGPRAEPGT